MALAAATVEFTIKKRMNSAANMDILDGSAANLFNPTTHDGGGSHKANSGSSQPLLTIGHEEKDTGRKCRSVFLCSSSRVSVVVLGWFFKYFVIIAIGKREADVIWVCVYIFMRSHVSCKNLKQRHMTVKMSVVICSHINGTKKSNKADCSFGFTRGSKENKRKWELI
jgi:hypothetical protein